MYSQTSVPTPPHGEHTADVLRTVQRLFETNNLGNMTVNAGHGIPTTVTLAMDARQLANLLDLYVKEKTK